MSSDSDKFILEEALASQDNDVFFNQKKWNYIVDATSNAGVFTNQIQFNLNTLASQGQWVNLSEAYIQFPIRTRIYHSGSGNQTPAAAGVLSTVLKNGFHHMIDSVSIVLDNTTIQMNQNFENVNATFKILTEWDANQYSQLAPTLGLSTLLDDFPSSGATTGLNNLPATTLVPSVRGIDLSTTSNTAIPQRQYEQNIDITNATANVLNGIVGATNAQNIGKSAVQSSTAQVVAGQDCYVQFVLATVRLADLSDSISKLPPIKNLRGFVYVNYNGAQVSFTTSNSSTITSWNYSTIQGRTMPAMIQNVASTGFQPASGAANTWTLECTVSGQKSSNLTTINPPINYARLVAPYYSANPEIDSALSQSKKIYYNERFINNFNCAANSSFNGTITPGIVNPKRLILVPYFTGIPANFGNVGASAISYQPFQSPFETAPATTSVYPVLRNLQCTVGNVPMFLNPVNMDYETFLNEVSNIGMDGGQNNELASGLLNQRLWSQLYRFYTIDISRRLTSEDGSSKGIQISFDNATNFPIQVFAFVLYERQFTVDTASCSVSK